MNYRNLLVGFVAIAFLSAATWGQAKKVNWFLVLKVEGKDVRLEVFGAGFDSVPEDDSPDTFALTGVKVDLVGRVDVNGDGKLDGKDKLAVDDKGELKLASGLNKKVIVDPTKEAEADVAVENSVEVPGHGRCAILQGSTLTVTKFRPSGKGHHVFSGTADLKLKTEKGRRLDVQGRWEAGTGEG